MKYLRVKGKGFFLFPRSIHHLRMAEMVCECVAVQVQSAGFVNVDRVGTPYCDGESIGLNIKSQAGDTDALRAQLEWEF